MLRVDTRGAARWLTLDRPARRNALTLELVRSLTEALQDLADLSAVVITGTGPVFCPGADNRLADEVRTGGAEAIAATIYGPLHGLVRAVRDAEVPVIAALNGPALGGGFDLALACDLRIAVPTAWLQSSWVTYGLIPGMGGAHAAERLVGSARASELLLLGSRVPADQALAWGLLNAVVDDLEVGTMEVVDRLAELPRQGVVANKRVLRRLRDAGLETELALLGAEQSRLMA